MAHGDVEGHTQLTVAGRAGRQSALTSPSGGRARSTHRCAAVRIAIRPPSTNGRDTVKRVMRDLHIDFRSRRRALEPLPEGGTMSEFWRRRVIDQLERGESLEQIDRELVQIRSISDDERAALWLLAWGEQQREKPVSGRFGRSQEDRVIGAGPRRSARSSGVDPITAALELARAETEMDVAVLGEICDGRELVRFVAGDGSFGVAPGASMPIEDTYCHRLLTRKAFECRAGYARR